VHAGAKRLQSTAYRICLIFLTGFGIVVSLMTWGRITFLRDGTQHTFPFTKYIMDGDDGACVIGLIAPACVLERLLSKKTVQLMLIHRADLYRSWFTTYFSMFSSPGKPERSLLIFLIPHLFVRSLFLYPLYRSSSTLSNRLRRLAKRTLWAALVALVTSATNVAVLMVLHGQELGWVCLGSCGTDVTINALALFFVTGSYDEPPTQLPLDTLTTPPSRRHSGNVLQRPLQSASAHQPGNVPVPHFDPR
jgi:hypothetical protein